MSERKTAVQACAEILKLLGDMDPEAMIHLRSLIFAPKINVLKLGRCGCVADLLKEGNGKMDLLAFLRHELPAEVMDCLEVKIEEWGAPGPDFRPVKLTLKGVTGYIEMVLGKHRFPMNNCSNYVWTIGEYSPLRFGGAVESWGFYDGVGEDGGLEDYCFPVVVRDGAETEEAEIYIDGLDFLVKVLCNLYKGS